MPQACNVIFCSIPDSVATRLAVQERQADSGNYAQVFDNVTAADNEQVSSGLSIVLGEQLKIVLFDRSTRI